MVAVEKGPWMNAYSIRDYSFPQKQRLGNSKQSDGFNRLRWSVSAMFELTECTMCASYNELPLIKVHVGAVVGQWVKRWPADLAVLGLISA